MMKDDPISEHVREARKKLIEQINNKYEDILLSVSRVLSDEEYCLNKMLGKFTFPMAFVSSGLELKRRDLAYLGLGKLKIKHSLWHISDTDGRKLLEWQIRRHARLLAWLMDRKDRKIRMLG